jgi:flagellar hook-basal body protein
MSLVSSLNVGVSSLRAYSEGIQVVSNNIANVNTVGYKASHAQYSDTFSNLLKPLVPNESNTAVKIAPTQIGGGVQVEAVAPVFSQGTIQATSSNSDLAIAGNGFFRVRNTQTGQVFVTRAGNFRVDADGYLVTQQGFRVQGAVGAKTKVVYDSETGSYDVKGPQDNEVVKIPSGLSQKVISGADTTLGSATVKVGSVEGLQVGMPLSGPGVVTGATIVSIDQKAKTFVMSTAGSSTQKGVSLFGNFKSMDSGSVSLTLPADYSRTDLVKGMVVSGPGIPTGTTIEAFSGNIKKTIPSSTSSLTLSKVTTTLGSASCTAESVEGLAPGMILSAGSGITNGAVVVSVDPANNSFTIDLPATQSYSANLSVVASGGKTLSSGSNVLNLKNVDGIRQGMRISGEGLPSAYVGEVSSVANIDSTFSVSMVDHPPSELVVTSFNPVTGSTSVPLKNNLGLAGGSTVADKYTVTVSDTSKLSKGDSVTQKVLGALSGVSFAAGSNTVTCTSTSGLVVGDVLDNVPGVPFGAEIVSVKDATTFTISLTTRNASGPIAAGQSSPASISTVDLKRTVGVVDSITDATKFVMTTSQRDGGSAPVNGTFTAYGQPVYPFSNSYSSVDLGFGDSTVVLSNRPTVDSFDDIALSLGTFYTPAAKVGDVKVAFDEGKNYDFYDKNGTQLTGIGLAVAQSGGPKIRTFNVGTAGDINVILSNGQTFTAGSVLLMSFRDPGALTREGDNLFSGLYTAGPYNGVWDDANIANFTPSYKGLGSINGGALELSNVDIGEEFSTMIITQRAFQAGSRVISTADQMLEEAVNLKR